MANDYSKFSYEELIKYIEELQAQLKSEKYGLYWDKNVEEEYAVSKIKNMLPIFSNNKELLINNGEINNILIEGENLHTLIGLSLVMQNNIDVIYIDPPYNTGNNDFIYNDKYVDSEDGYKHSKWLNMMQKRLQLARELLKEEGVLFISIDEHELFQLKILCDSIFNEKNFVENFIWIKNSIKNLSLTTSNNHEYVLCYTKNIKKLSSLGYFKKEKPGLKDVYELINNAQIQNNSIEETTEKLKKFYKSNPQLKGISMYNNVEVDSNGNYKVFRVSDISAPISKGSLNNYTVLHPITNKPCKVPSRGWAYSEETMKKNIEEGLIYFNKDESYVPAYKRYLNNVELEVCKSTFENFDEGKRDLADVFLSNDIFNNPKPVSLIKNLLSMILNKKALILDFFAGSGTTGQAVLKLNKEDGGNRRFILCTNNENNICTDVTYPRLKTVITGIRPDGTKYSEGIPANLIYYKTDFIKDSNNTDQAKYCLVEKVDELLCISEDIFIPLERNDYSSHYVSNDETSHMFIYSDYYNETKFKEFKQRVLNAAGTKVVYIFSSDNNVDGTLFEGVKDVEVKPIPSKIYEIYKEIVEDIKRG